MSVRSYVLGFFDECRDMKQGYRHMGYVASHIKNLDSIEQKVMLTPLEELQRRMQMLEYFMCLDESENNVVEEVTSGRDLGVVVYTLLHRKTHKKLVERFSQPSSEN